MNFPFVPCSPALKSATPDPKKVAVCVRRENEPARAVCVTCCRFQYEPIDSPDLKFGRDTRQAWQFRPVMTAGVCPSKISGVQS